MPADIKNSIEFSRLRPRHNVRQLDRLLPQPTLRVEKRHARFVLAEGLDRVRIHGRYAALG